MFWVASGSLWSKLSLCAICLLWMCFSFSHLMLNEFNKVLCKYTHNYINIYDNDIYFYVFTVWNYKYQVYLKLNIDLCLTFIYNMLEIHYIISGKNNFKIFLVECRLRKAIWEFCIWRTLLMKYLHKISTPNNYKKFESYEHA